jgi:hypothetical protein
MANPIAAGPSLMAIIFNPFLHQDPTRVTAEIQPGARITADTGLNLRTTYLWLPIEPHESSEIRKEIGLQRRLSKRRPRPDTAEPGSLCTPNGLWRPCAGGRRGPSAGVPKSVCQTARLETKTGDDGRALGQSNHAVGKVAQRGATPDPLATGDSVQTWWTHARSRRRLREANSQCRG